jgi:hypothetical protein
MNFQMTHSLSHPAESWEIANKNGPITFFWSISKKSKAIPDFVNLAVNAITSLNALGPFRFRYRESHSESSLAQERFIEVSSGEGCHTAVGKQDTNKIICDLPNPGYGPSALFHEFMHKLGEGHAHQSKDRNHYVRITSTDTVNYVKTSPRNLEPYDLYSIMHYSLSSQLQLRDKADIVSHLQALGLNQAAINLIWDLRSEIGKSHLISYFDVQKLLKIATIINDEITFSANKVPLCGLISGTEYKPQNVLKLLELFTNPTYTASGFSARDFITIETQDCVTVNLLEIAQISPFITKVNCHPIANLPPYIKQQGCSLFLSTANHFFHQAYDIEFSISNKITASSLYWKHRPDIAKLGNCTVIPEKTYFSAPNEPLIEYPEYTQQENLPRFNPMTSWEDMGWTFLKSSSAGVTHGILFIALRKLQSKFKLGFCSRYVLSQISPYLLNSLISIIASWESIEDANALNMLLKLIDKNGFIYKSYTDGLNLEDTLTQFCPYAVGILSTLSLNYLISKFFSKNSFFPCLTVALSTFLSTLSATRNPKYLLKALLVSVYYLVGNSLVQLADQLFLNETKQIANNIESETDLSQLSLSQGSPTIHITPNPNECNKSQTSINAAFISASKTVTPNKFYTAFRNCFFKAPKLSEENNSYDLPASSTTPVPV